MPTQPSKMWAIPLEEAKKVIRPRALEEPKAWKCPCVEKSCHAWVVYGRDSDGRVLLMMTVSYRKEFAMVELDKPADVDALPGYEPLDAGDRGVLHVYLTWGLGSALRREFVGRA